MRPAAVVVCYAELEPDRVEVVARLSIAAPLVGEAAELLPGERRHPDDLGPVRTRRVEAPQPVDVDPYRAADLERTRVDHVRLRGTVRPRASLDDVAPDTIDTLADLVELVRVAVRLPNPTGSR